MVELGLQSGSPDGLSCIQVGCSHHAFSDKHHVDGAACGGPAAGGWLSVQSRAPKWNGHCFLPSRAATSGHTWRRGVLKVSGLQGSRTGPSLRPPCPPCL